jgi:hypothetical protein
MSTAAAHRVGLLFGLVAASLAVMSSLHLSGALAGEKPFQGTHAGVAEALIAVVLALGAAALLRDWKHSRAVALAANLFAIAGVVVGLSFTVRGGGAVDVAYHAIVLPVLLLTLATLLRRADTTWRVSSRPGW